MATFSVVTAGAIVSAAAIAGIVVGFSGIGLVTSTTGIVTGLSVNLGASGGGVVSSLSTAFVVASGCGGIVSTGVSGAGVVATGTTTSVASTMIGVVGSTLVGVVEDVPGTIALLKESTS